ncbi:MAG: VOC family protein [Alphaproteobacteria bacterium]|nr:VOC family protein [Alphaproteobacteria bacterium]
MDAPSSLQAPAPPLGRKARPLGLHHVALRVGNIDEALRFYGRLFDFTLLDRTDSAAYLDLVEQFLLLEKGSGPGPAGGRHVGLLVDDTRAVRRALTAAGIAPLPGPFLHVLDPWGNRLEFVSYD